MDREGHVEEPVSVLVVDDSPPVRMIFEGLQEVMWHRLLTASTGDEASQILERENPVIIVIDISMQEFNEMNFIDWLQSKVPYATVIVLTGKESTKKAREAIRQGIWDYVEKPIQLPELIRVMTDAVERVKFISGQI